MSKTTHEYLHTFGLIPQEKTVASTVTENTDAHIISVDMDLIRDLSIRWTLSSIDILTISPQALHHTVLYRKSWSDIFLNTKQKQTLHYFRNYPHVRRDQPPPSSSVPSVADYFDLLDRLLINDSWYMPDRLSELVIGHTALSENLRINCAEIVAVKERAPHPDLCIVLERWEEQLKVNEEYLFMLKGLERRRHTGFDPVHIFDERWKNVPCV